MARFTSCTYSEVSRTAWGEEGIFRPQRAYIARGVGIGPPSGMTANASQRGRHVNVVRWPRLGGVETEEAANIDCRIPKYGPAGVGLYGRAAGRQARSFFHGAFAVRGRRARG